MKVALYARVSRDDLHCENQKLVLDEWVKREGASDVKYFFEEVSSRKTRPEKEKVLQGFRKGEFDTIVCVKLDRFARSLQELIMDIEGIVNSGGRFIAISNGMDFQKKSYNASQQLMLNIFGAFAQFEREMIRERTLDGLARAKAQGKKLGRPFKDGSKNQVNYLNPNESEVWKLHLIEHKSLREIAALLKTSKNRVAKILEKTPPVEFNTSSEEKVNLS